MTVTESVRAAEETEFRVHRSVYTDPAVFEREMTQIFERGWVYLAHESELALTGDYKTVHIGRQPAIVARHRDGEIYVLMNRCMHRGSLVCMDEAGNSSGFRCIYHGWTYDTSGDLLGVPYPQGFGPNFNRKDFALVRAPRVASHRGFVFASLAAGGPSLPEFLGPAARYLDLLSDQSVTGQLTVRRRAGRYLVNANWKLQVENLCDGYHPRFTHETAFGVIAERTGRNPGLASGEKSAARCIGFEGGHTVLDYSAAGRGYSMTNSPEGLAYRSQLAERLGAARAAEAADADLQVYLMPNFFVQTSRQHIRIIRPLAVDKTEVQVYPYALEGAGEAATAAQLSAVAWWATPASFGQPEDIEALARCQDGLAVTGADWVFFNRGLGREEPGPDGELIGNITDELPSRAFHTAWRKLMAGDAVPGATGIPSTTEGQGR